MKIILPERGTYTKFKRHVLAVPFMFHPTHWERVTRIAIIDADGWDRSVEVNGQGVHPWGAPLTLDEFLTRAASSTAHYPKGFFDEHRWPHYPCPNGDSARGTASVQAWPGAVGAAPV